MKVNAMCDDFGIGFGLKSITGSHEFGAQGFVVFDNAVMNDGDSIAGDMGVCIALARNPVCRPARMCNAHQTRHRLNRQCLFETSDFSDGA